MNEMSWQDRESMNFMAQNQYKHDIADTSRSARETARRSAETRELLDALVAHAAAADAVEKKMLRWTILGVILAGVAAVASIVAIVVAVLIS